jgi:predicted DNA-binding protein
MTGTITIRLPGPAARRIRARAKALGVTPSAIVRAALESEMGTLPDESTAYELTQRWVGAVRSKSAPRGRDTRRALERWRPDRRG